MIKPNLFIAGYAKSGTTALYHYFLNHNDIYCNEYLKEPRFFSYKYFLQTNAYKYIIRNAIKTEREYLELYSNYKNEKYIVDGSVYYSSFKGISKEIKQFNENSKVVLIIRDPSERFFSHYMMHLKSGFKNVTLNEFYQTPFSSEGLNLLEIGKYYNSIKEYIYTFGKENVFIGVYDDLITNPEDFHKRLCSFLSIEYLKGSNEFVNISGKPKSVLFIKVLKIVKRLFPKKIINKLTINNKTKINNLLYNKVTLDKERLPLKNREQLIKYYKSDIKKVETLINRDLSSWYKV